MRLQHGVLLFFIFEVNRFCYASTAPVNSVVGFCFVGRDRTITNTWPNNHRFPLAAILSNRETPYYPSLPDALLQRDKTTVEVAIRAVVKACHVSGGLQPSETNEGISTITKTDLSPVTVADYAVQAIVLQHLNHFFPSDDFVAEEDSIQLKRDGTLAEEVLRATGMLSLEDLSGAVDLGQGKGTQAGAMDDIQMGAKRRIWCLDPIDGTRGFLRGKEQGGQFCVALALLEDGVPVLGILGCPNLCWSLADDDKHVDVHDAMPKGCLFVAVKGAGCYQLPLYRKHDGLSIISRKLTVTPSDGSRRPLQQARMCMGVEKYSDARGLTSRMAQLISGSEEEGHILSARRVDSQVKYGLIARGEGEFYVRLPKIGYQEWIWDHAAGSVVIEEARGTLTDTEGNAIDFSLGRQLSASIKGILGSNGGMFHRALLDSYRRAENELLACQKVKE